jgi:hypothetical protein
MIVNVYSTGHRFCFDDLKDFELNQEGLSASG